jgi:rhodanese-related sulfurtransferase
MDVRLEITPDELERMRSAGEDFYLIDVREREEYEEEGHIPGALLVPLHEIEEKLKGIRKDRSLVLYCHVGARSKEACIALTRAGWTNVKTLRGGYDAWR